MLFDEVADDHDWFDVCPNADVDMPSDEDMRLFDMGRLYLTERDRHRVQHIIHKGHCNRKYLMLVLTYTVDRGYKHGIMFAARELYQKVPDEIVASAIAFSHPGGSRRRLHFPKKVTNIPKSLMKAFGLRTNQIGWFNKLAANEDFVRLIGGGIKPEDWKHIPLYDTTLLESNQKEATAPQLEETKGATLW